MLKNNLILLSKFFGLIFFYSILSCCYSVSGHQNNEVMKRVAEYFQNEKKGDWAAVYAMRSPKYQSVVDEAGYIQKMSKDHNLISLIDYSISESEIRADKAGFKIKFEYIYLKDDMKKFSVTNYVKWKKIDGEWYCVDAGIRGLFPLNAEIAPEN